jgi:hypothetical protein
MFAWGRVECFPGATMARSLEQLESERAELLRQLAESGDMRRGSINEVYRRGGKDNCACADPGHPGHGPFYAYTTKVSGKTKTLQLRPGPLLSKALNFAAPPTPLMSASPSTSKLPNSIPASYAPCAVPAS